MPRKEKMDLPVEPAQVSFPKELVDRLVPDPMTPEGVETMFRQLKKVVIERALGAEMTEHLGYGTGEAKPEGSTNSRNGGSGRTVLTDEGSLRIEVPRDREGKFESLLIGKHERRFEEFEAKIIAMYARGMTVHEIQGFLAEMSGWRPPSSS